MKAIALFNNKGGVGKTSLVYHLAWMFSDLGVDVVAADFDPRANLSAMFLDVDRLQDVWAEEGHPRTIFGAVEPVLRGTGDVAAPHLEEIAPKLALLVGDTGLLRLEARLSEAWPRCMAGDEAAFRAVSSFHRILTAAAEQRGAEVVLIDLGADVGAVTRSAVIAANDIAVPLASDLQSLQALKSLGPTLREWRADWQTRLAHRPDDPALLLPSADMVPIGYVVLLDALRVAAPVRSHGRWLARIPEAYHSEILATAAEAPASIVDDPNCLATLKNYRSLMALAQEARKPMFSLKPADGALGAHMQAVQECHLDFERLAIRIAEKSGIRLG